MLSLGWLVPLTEVEAVAGVDVVAETIVKAARRAVSVGLFAMRSFRRKEEERWMEGRTTRHVSKQMASSLDNCYKRDAGAMLCEIGAVDVQGKGN